MFVLRTIGQIIKNFLTRLIEVVIFVVILAVVGNNPRFFGNISQYLVDWTKAACAHFGYSWGMLQGIGLSATLLTVLVFYVAIRFTAGLIAHAVTGKAHGKSNDKKVGSSIPATKKM